MYEGAHVEKKLLVRDRALRRRLDDGLLPGLPVDADPVQTRHPTPRVGSLMDGLVSDLLQTKSAFFDAVCEQWESLCPDSPMRPGRFQDGHLFLYVKTSGQLFAQRSRLPKIKKQLLPLPGAPKRLNLHLEIHA